MPDLIVGTLMSWGLSATVANAVVNLGASVLLSAAAQAIAGSQYGAGDASREVARPTSLPSYRHVYGRGVRIQGTPAPLWVVKDGVLYGCIILNSRPSDGSDFALYLDRRPVGLSGDPRDFGEVASGTAVVPEGSSSVNVLHGLSGAPSSAGRAAWTDAGLVSTSTIGATTLRISLGSPAPAGGTAVTWRAVKPTDGGAAQNSPFSGHVNVWLGRGDQQHPPARLLEEVGDLRGLNPLRFWASDRWSNCTVLWVRLVAGASATRLDRWPSTPPLIEVQANWSRVWDPRDPAQDPSDPSTWLVSDNQALCALDALRCNPIARYGDSELMLDTFIEGADIADEVVRLKSGGVERRYRVGCLIEYRQSTELSDAIEPLLLAGAGSIIRAGGLLGYLPGAWSDPVLNLDEVLRDEPLRFRSLSDERNLPWAMTVTHPDPASNWEDVDEAPRAVRAGWDGSDDQLRKVSLSAVFSSTQAQRVLLILLRRLQLQRQLTGVFPPVAIQLLAGSRVTVAVPRAGDRRSGIYRVEAAHPARFLEDGDGVAMRMPLTLTADAASVYDWDYIADDVPRQDQFTVPADPSILYPSSISAAVNGLKIDVTAYELGWWTMIDNNPVSFNPYIDSVEVQFRRNQESFWLPVNDLTVNYVNKTRTIENLLSGSSYDVRVRGVIGDRVGPWLISYAAQVGFALGAATSATATGGVRSIDVELTAPADATCAAVQIWSDTSGAVESATLLAEILCSPSDPITYTAAGLDPAATYWIFVRPVTADGAVGPWVSLTATTT